MKNKELVKFDFRYNEFQKLCTICGSLKHEFEMCKELSTTTETI